jgi:AcrR family transcriptional regulator
LTKPHHHGHLKQALIDLALAAAQDGAIEAMSLREASRQLGVSSGAVYRHFADKDSLMQALAQHGFSLLAQTFEQAVPFASHAADGPQAEARFVALGQAYAAFALGNYGLWRLMFGPQGAGAIPLPGDRPSTYDWLRKCLHELYQWGVIANPPDTDAEYFAWSVVHGLADLQSSPATRQADVAQRIGRLCRMIIAALHADPRAGP